MRNDRLVCVDDFERYAYKHLELKTLDYYRSGANNEQTLRENRNAFSRFRLRPRFLRDVSRRCLETTVLGNKISFPVGVSPTAMQRMAHPDGEVATAKAAESLDTIMILSAVGTSSVEEIAENAPNLLRWLQLNVYFNRQIARELVNRAEKSGFKALVVTVDSPMLGLRLTGARDTFSLPKHLRMANFDVHVKSSDSQVAKKEADLSKYAALLDTSTTWDVIGWLRTITDLPIVVKGIVTAEDARLSLQHGAAAIMVSNHGGRQLDGVPATIEVLPEIVKEVNGRCEVYLDGGIRTGTDILKALALGARAVFVGRPMLWGLVYDIIQKIAGEIQAMKQERDKISEHIDRTEIWSENLGNWAATIYSVLEYLEDDKIVPYFFIVVHPFGESYKTVLTGGESIGWIVSRKFQDFHLIHSKLLPAAPWVKKVDLPTQSKWFRFLNSGEQLEKAKLQLQVFLSKIMEDDQLNKSEALYSFLSPSPGYLKTVCISNEKRRFSLTSLFKSNSDMAEGASKDEYVFLDDFDFKDDRKDSIAESLYSLIGEVFELHGVFKWLRKSLIVFVQVTFGQTINRQIRDTVSWFFSESMLLFYINTFKDSMWPDGKMAPAWPARSDESKQQTRIQAKAQVLSNIPGVLVNLVGQQNADRGVNKMFEAMQDKRLNKQLIYNLIEDFVKQFGPELKDFSTHRL